MYLPKKPWVIVASMASLVLLLWSGFLIAAWQWSTSKRVEAKVITTWTKDNWYYASVVYSDGLSRNLQVRDNFWWLTFNASDRWALLKKNEGKVVSLRPVGLRIEFLSWFPNPVSVCDASECK